MAALGRILRLGAIDGIGPFALTREAPQPPGPGEILVRIEGSSLNYHDYAVVTGRLGAKDGVTPMSDGAGIVEAVGEGVTDFAVGDQAVSLFFPNWADGEIRPTYASIVPGDRNAQGYARDYATAPATWFTRAPAGWSSAESATLPCAALTAWRALMVEAKIKPGDWVMTQGTGGVSLFALQFAKAAGARVVATSSSDEKLEKLRAMGADALINYRDTPDWGSAVAKATDGGADVVIEIGGGSALAQSIRACRMAGHISLIGVLSGFKGEVPTAELMGRGIHLVGITVGSRTHQHDMIRAIDANGIRPVIDRAFPLEELADAFAYQASGAHFGKIVIDLAQGQPA